ncbi:MAG: hypothetical protein L6U99_15150 [Clostridium sp.]|nr:MAG: hypothetical protein L6U99_15150 [Clostridium sp.]
MNTLYNEFLDLRTTYQTAFMQFYSDEYNKLMDLVKKTIMMLLFHTSIVKSMIMYQKAMI